MYKPTSNSIYNNILATFICCKSWVIVCNTHLIKRYTTIVILGLHIQHEYMIHFQEKELR